MITNNLKISTMLSTEFVIDTKELIYNNLILSELSVTQTKIPVSHEFI